MISQKHYQQVTAEDYAAGAMKGGTLGENPAPGGRNG
jgi:hypothetical protein